MYKLDCQATCVFRAIAVYKKGTISDARRAHGAPIASEPRQNLKDEHVISLQCQWGPSRVIIAVGARRERAAAPLASQRDGGGRAAGRREGRTTVDSRSGQRGENNWPRKSKKKNCRRPGFYGTDGCEDLSLSEARRHAKSKKPYAPIPTADVITTICNPVRARDKYSM